MINWRDIDTVLLDMDGTLLDLHYDNHFWKEFLPVRYAEQKDWTVEQAKAHLTPLFKSKEGSLEWYCLDYWSDCLQLDIIGLKAEVSSLITLLPHAKAFLDAIKRSYHKVLLVTNAHRGSLDLKLEKTGLRGYFDKIISSHDFGLPKEQVAFWQLLQEQHPFNKQTTLLIDDNISVLNSARSFGIAHLISISLPDSKRPKRLITDYPAIEDFRALMSGL